MSERIETTIDTELLPYPDSLGNNGAPEIRGIAHGCVICQMCLEEGAREPLSFSTILRESSKVPDLLAICETSPHCGELLKKFRDGTYKALYEGGKGYDDILILKIKDDYNVSEGKHRVCVAKRFGIREIPVLLDIV